MIVKRHQENSLASPFAMSFLDTVSAGFGAAFFLFIIFASFPIVFSSGMLGSSQFMEVEITWDDPGISIYPVIYFNGRAITVKENVPETGAIIADGHTETYPGVWQKAFSSGSSLFGTQGIYDTTANERGLKINILGPCTGDWKFDLVMESFDPSFIDASGNQRSRFQTGNFNGANFNARLRTNTQEEFLYVNNESGNLSRFGYLNPAMLSSGPGSLIKVPIHWTGTPNLTDPTKIPIINEQDAGC